MNDLKFIAKVNENFWETDHFAGLSKDRESRDIQSNAIVLKLLGRKMLL